VEKGRFALRAPRLLENKSDEREETPAPLQRAGGRVGCGDAPEAPAADEDVNAPMPPVEDDSKADDDDVPMPPLDGDSNEEVVRLVIDDERVRGDWPECADALRAQRCVDKKLTDGEVETSPSDSCA